MKMNGGGFKEPADVGVVTDQESLEVPEIFRLIQGGASTPEVLQQLTIDFYRDSDPEKLFLGIQELQSRDLESAAALTVLSKGTDRLGKLIKQVIESDAQGAELEKMLGIKRWGTKLNLEALYFPQWIEMTHKYAVFKGYTTLDLEAYIDQYDSQLEPTNISPQLTGRIKDHHINTESTFGMFEPTYLELVGPRELLRLRHEGKGEFLLLGSLGSYSAQNFRWYSEKIHPCIQSHVIDVDYDSLQRIREDFPDTNQVLVQADARHIPYVDESIDHVYTNHLFHYLYLRDSKMKSHEDMKRGIKSIFSGVARVLKRGGSFVVVEQRYGAFKKDKIRDGYRKMRREIMNIARQSGFKIANTFDEGIGCMLFVENGKATIDENGFPHYEDVLLESSNSSCSVRFVKV